MSNDIEQRLTNLEDRMRHVLAFIKFLEPAIGDLFEKHEHSETRLEEIKKFIKNPT